MWNNKKIEITHSNIRLKVRIHSNMCNSDKRHNSTVCHALLVSLKLTSACAHLVKPDIAAQCATPLMVPRRMLEDCII